MGGERETPSDVWAWGMLVWEVRDPLVQDFRDYSEFCPSKVITKEMPFAEVKAPFDLTNRIMNAQPPKVDQHTGFKNLALVRHLLTKCWAKVPEARPAMTQITTELGTIVQARKEVESLPTTFPTATGRGENKASG